MAEKRRSWDNYANRGPHIGNVVVEHYNAFWDNSPKVHGRLQLRANAYYREHWRNTVLVTDGLGSALPDSAQTPGTTGESRRAYDSAYSHAYGRFRRKLYEGSASLGVTVGSYKQSREMIVSRSRTITAQAHEIISDFGRRHQVRGRALKRLANGYLETVFGWQPLLADIKNACDTVIQLADKRASARGIGSSPYYVRVHEVSSDRKRAYELSINGNVNVTISSLVTISNPNRWLAERAGLLNVASVAWDLVPWSFVMNMFANTGQLVGSITDFAGLHFDNQSVTTTFYESGSASSSYDERWDWPPPGYSVHSRSMSAWHADRKIREVGSIPRPSLVLKLPGADWELAAIAVSLMVVQVSRVGGILREMRG